MNVRISPAMGMITDSDTFRIMENTPGEKPTGDVPTWDATSATCWFTASNIPERLSMIPLTSISFSQSVIA